MFRNTLTALLLAALCGLASAGPMTLLEEAAEFQRLDARVSDDDRGYLRIANCDGCEQMRLEINSATSLEIDGEPRPLKTLNRAALRDGTVFYDPQTKRVKRIVAYR